MNSGILTSDTVIFTVCLNYCVSILAFFETFQNPQIDLSILSLLFNRFTK